jgi:hypothetical protein
MTWKPARVAVSIRQQTSGVWLMRATAYSWWIIKRMKMETMSQDSDTAIRDALLFVHTAFPPKDGGA